MTRLESGRAGTRHLIHVGFPKAASKSLQAWFAAHPDLSFDYEGFAGYERVRDLAYDVVGGNGATWHVTSCEVLVTPKLPAQSLDALAPGRTAEHRRLTCELLHSLFPAASILIVTRSHSTVLPSGYSQYVRRGGHIPLARARAVAHMEVEDEWDYDAAVTLYESTFGPDNVIVLPYEMLVEDAERFTAIIEERLGIPHIDYEMPHLNTSLTSAELRWYPRLSAAATFARRRLGAPGRALAARYFAGIGHRRLSRFVALLARVHPEPPIDFVAEYPPEILAGYRRRAVALAHRAEYESYRAAYLGAGRVPDEARTVSLPSSAT